MKVLAVDSSAVTASAALAEDGKILAEFFQNNGLTHSQTLMPMVKAVLDFTGTDVRGIDLFAVTNGPGSYTGVRIGTSAVKGMAGVCGKPCVGVSTLLAAAHNLSDRDGVICAAMDARCGQVYTASFLSDGKNIERLTDDDAIPISELGGLLDELTKKFKKNVIFVGDGAKICYTNLSELLPDAAIASEQLRYQRTSGVLSAVFGHELYRQAVRAEELTAVYLRPSQAERERMAKDTEQESKNGYA
ncbi:MAG: tRNA (adenosine(37)-N6)-threonylcarbamoyltransferase complex dimerization subunit type 1 TsaB [Oscillospiraceae bacterium]|nr:tRNA (adenosine(37)-N6)-threonylcarbamoyltransferase complex dimerization subunit type 1 TsaB [Oscillospiraceae bacterium]